MTVDTGNFFLAFEYWQSEVQIKTVIDQDTSIEGAVLAKINFTQNCSFASASFAIPAFINDTSVYVNNGTQLLRFPSVTTTDFSECFLAMSVVNADGSALNSSVFTYSQQSSPDWVFVNTSNLQDGQYFSLLFKITYLGQTFNATLHESTVNLVAIVYNSNSQYQ